MYSGKEIIRAGEELLDGDLIKRPNEYQNAMDVLSYWRFSHEEALVVAFNLLQETAKNKDKNAILAKRLKRTASIVSKLRRFEKMKLKNMQDIGGCRAIVSNEKKLRQIVRELRKQPNFKHTTGKIKSKDYIVNPKEDGYRGYHLIGEFLDKSIELQIRTTLQHGWATALEIVDLFTGQALKSNRGRADWKEFFCLVSDQFAIMENINQFGTLSDARKFQSYRERILSSDSLIENCKATQKSCKNLNVIHNLHAYANSLRIIDDRLNEMPISGYALIEVDTKKSQVKSTLFSEDMNTIAEESYKKAEQAAATENFLVVALVSTNAVGGLKEAYPNYFADSTEFVKHLHLITSLELPTQNTRKWDKFWNLFR